MSQIKNLIQKRRKYFEMNESKNILNYVLINIKMHQEQCLEGNLSVNTYINKVWSEINNLTLHLEELEKEKQTKPKTSKRKEIIKIQMGKSEIDKRKIRENQ